MPGRNFPSLVPVVRPISTLPVLLLMVAGCGSDPPASQGISDPPLEIQASSSGDFYPLDQGNRWTYAGETRIALQSDDGSPPSEQVLQIDEERVIDGVERRFDRDYLIERQTTIESNDPTPIVYWIRNRQDRSGLYEADVAVSEPPMSAGRPAATLTAAAASRRAAPPPALLAGASTQVRPHLAAAWERLESKRVAALAAVRRGALARPAPTGVGDGGELTRLLYPLRPGQDWDIRLDPPFGSRVEGHEMLETPAGTFPAWRIRVLPPDLGNGDDVVYWYSRCGYLGLSVHIETDVIGPGGPFGTLKFDQEMRLTGIDIGRSGGCRSAVGD